MPISRRQFLLSSSGLLCAPSILSAKTGPKVVVIGGGWGGLAAARHLAPHAQVTLIERNSEFTSLPLSNRWLVGFDKGERLHQNYQKAAAEFGYRFVQAEVRGFDMNRREVSTSTGHFKYDWLIVSAGISETEDAFLNGDKKTITEIRKRFPSAYTAGNELEILKQKLANFSGGEFLMNIPLAPYRCPPAPYERAAIIAHIIKSKKLKARLTVVEPNAPWAAYRRVFDEQFDGIINYLPNTQLRELDPSRQIATMDIDELKFNDAIIMPPQQAAELCLKNGLTGKNSAWATVNPRNFAFLEDQHVFVIGDSVGPVSKIFGHYPKTGEIALRMGQIAAIEIINQISGKVDELELPQGTCFAYLSLNPPEFTQIDSRYRVRGDGEIIQKISQKRENNPRGEDDAWLNSRHQELFGASTKV